MLLMDGAITVAAYLCSSFFGEVSSCDCNSELSVVKNASFNSAPLLLCTAHCWKLGMALFESE